jgi:hypothetical protein
VAAPSKSNAIQWFIFMFRRPPRECIGPSGPAASMPADQRCMVGA